MRPAATLACLLPIGLAMLAALQATPLTAQAPAKAKAIGPKPDDPRAKEPKAIGPKPDDPKAKDPKAIGPKPDDPKGKDVKAIGPKPDDPRAKEAKGAAKQVPAKR
jgi:hypothetical protein